MCQSRKHRKYEERWDKTEELVQEEHLRECVQNPQGPERSTGSAMTTQCFENGLKRMRLGLNDEETRMIARSMNKNAAGKIEIEEITRKCVVKTSREGETMGGKEHYHLNATSYVNAVTKVLVGG